MAEVEEHDECAARRKHARIEPGHSICDVLPVVLIDTIQEFLPLSTRIKVMRVVCKALNSLKGEARRNYAWANSCNTPIMKRCAVRCFGTYTNPFRRQEKLTPPNLPTPPTKSKGEKKKPN